MHFLFQILTSYSCIWLILLKESKKFCLGAQFTHFTGAVEKHMYELSTWSLADMSVGDRMLYSHACNAELCNLLEKQNLSILKNNFLHDFVFPFSCVLHSPFLLLPSISKMLFLYARIKAPLFHFPFTSLYLKRYLGFLLYLISVIQNY